MIYIGSPNTRCITITMVYNAISAKISDEVTHNTHIGALILEVAVGLISSENIATC